jgi:hypothetical protein
MVTVVNSPPNQTQDNSGWVIAAILFVLLILALVYFRRQVMNAFGFGSGSLNPQGVNLDLNNSQDTFNPQTTTLPQNSDRPVSTAAPMSSTSQPLMPSPTVY